MIESSDTIVTCPFYMVSKQLKNPRHQIDPPIIISQLVFTIHGYNRSIDIGNIERTHYLFVNRRGKFSTMEVINPYIEREYMYLFSRLSELKDDDDLDNRFKSFEFTHELNPDTIVLTISRDLELSFIRFCQQLRIDHHNYSLVGLNFPTVNDLFIKPNLPI